VLYGSDPVTCPVRTLRAWLDAAQISRGPVFRVVHKRSGFVGDRALCDRMVAIVVQRLADAAGVAPATSPATRCGAGSPRPRARAGKSEASIMRQTRHKSVSGARRYIPAGTRWDDHAGASIGL
jgi:hypothetical protein